MTNDSDKILLKETAETLVDVKNKLLLQTIQRETYEKDHSEMMDILDIPMENRFFSNILPALKNLKESNGIKHEEIESNHNSNVVVESQEK